MDNVLTTLYLLFSEGYYSISQNTTLRRDFCTEAMRLVYLLTAHDHTNLPKVNALLSLMCFHASRFDARSDQNGETILYQDQDESLWNMELIDQGKYYLGLSAAGGQLSKYHLEAGIAYWHTHKEDTKEKWDQILQLYNNLLILEYSPIVALNRTYALAKVSGKLAAIAEAEKLKLTDNHFYYSLLGNLYTDVDQAAALQNYKQALDMAVSNADKQTISRHIEQLGA
jgi:RNA polymerase sigma-70 factor (ECF subfamily)